MFLPLASNSTDMVACLEWRPRLDESARRTKKCDSSCDSCRASLGSTFDSADMNGQMAKLDKAYGMLQQLQASYPKM